MSEQNQLAETQPRNVKDYLALPSYRDRFHEVMGKRANQFMAAIVASSQLPGLKDAEPRSIIAAAMVAATLDLPVNPTLGQAHIVAYSDGQGQKVAQFQIGYKGLIQLALRSGQYKRLNAGAVSADVFTGFDVVGEPILDFTKNDPTSDAAGYYCAFETLNGFIKVIYWSKQQAEAHAKRFSRAYAKGYSTPWKSDFDSMATKTVIKAALGKWGLLSVEMQKAVVHDQGAQTDVDTEVAYVDNDETSEAEITPAAPRPTARPKSTKGAAAVKENVPKTVDAEVEVVTSTTATPAPETPAATVEPSKPVEQPKAEPKATTPKAASKIVQRTSLTDKEVITVTCSIYEFKTLDITKAGAVNPGIAAEVSGPEFKGKVMQLVGAKVVDGKKEAFPQWQMEQPVQLTLRGEFSPKMNKVVTWVEKIEIPGAQTESPSAEGDV